MESLTPKEKKLLDVVNSQIKQSQLAADNRARANELLMRMLSSTRSQTERVTTGIDTYA